MLHTPFYDPTKTYEENFERGPFGAFSKTKKVKNNTSPKYSFLGYKVNFPFGIPAGPLLNGNYMKAALNMGFDIVVYKTQRSVPIEANKFPNILYVNTFGDLTVDKTKQPLLGKKSKDPRDEKFSITNSFGNPSKGPAFWKEDLKNLLKNEDEGQMIIISVCGTLRDNLTKEEYYEDFAISAEIANETGVKAIELNLSCPNVANEGILCYTPEAVESICQKARNRIGNTPLIAKLGYFSEEKQDLLEDIVKRMSPYIQALSIINTIPAPVVNEKGEQALPGQNRLYSGICGAGIKWAGIDNVRRLNKLREDKKYKYEIIGVGGVMEPKDYLDYKKVGADVVMSATGAMWNPFLAQEIKNEM